MNEWKSETREGVKNVIIEVADVFLKMSYPDGSSMEEIPDTTIIEDDKEREQEEKVVHLSEKRAQILVIKEVLAKAQSEGYKYFRMLTVDQVRAKLKQDLPLGLNGMYLLIFWNSPSEKAMKNFHSVTDTSYINEYFVGFA